MSLAALLNRPMTLVRRSDSGDVDGYGNMVYDETPVDVVGELQQIRRDEPAGEEFSDTRWLVFLPAGTDVSTRDLLLNGDDEYEFVGEPWPARNPRTQVVSHIEATVRRTAGAGDDDPAPEEDPP